MLYLDTFICQRLEFRFRPKSLEPPKGLGWSSDFPKNAKEMTKDIHFGPGVGGLK